MEKELNWTNIMADPEAHGFKVCSHCNGYGSSLKEQSDKCTHCGGLGLVPVGAQHQRN